MKILFVSTPLYLAGAEKVVYMLFKGLAKKSYDITSCTVIDGHFDTSRSTYYAEVRKLGIRTMFLTKKYKKDASLFMQLMALILKEKPDVIHAHLQPAIVYAVLCSFFARVSCIVTYHGMGAGESMADKIAFKYASAVVTVCEAQRNSLINHGIMADKITTIHNGIEISEDDSSNIADLQKELNIAENDFVFGNVANLIKYKNQALLIRAFKRVVENGHKDVKLFIVGEGLEKENLASLIVSLGLTGRVILLGGRKDVKSILRIMDVFVLSSDTEGFSISILEAMANKKAVIATDVGGNSELVMNQKTGIIVPPNNIDALCSAMKYLLMNRNRINEMGLEGYERSKEEFNLDKMVSEYEILYTSLSKNKSIYT